MAAAGHCGLVIGGLLLVFELVTVSVGVRGLAGLLNQLIFFLLAPVSWTSDGISRSGSL